VDEKGGRTERRGLCGAALVLSAAVALVFVLVPGAAGARAPVATITVDTTADSTGGPDCSLRDAITAANTDASVGGCNAGNGPDRIRFSLSGQISLDSTLPVVTSALSLDGSGQNIVISGQGSVRVLEVSQGAALALREVAIVDGNAADAGGILNRGTLFVAHDTLSGNRTSTFGSGGGIWNQAGATLIALGTTFSANGEPDGTLGGGIYNSGRALVANSSFSNNGGDHGGAIFNAEGGILAVGGSTVSGNSAGEGGGLMNQGRLTVRNTTFDHNFTTIGVGGAISGDGSLTVARSSFSENSGISGGAIESRGALVVARSTFSGNGADSGGAIESRSSFQIVESTFAGNSARDGGGLALFGSGTIQRSTFTLNQAEDDGGGIAMGGTVIVLNSTFAGNTTTGPGGGVLNRFGTLTVKSSTFVGNSSGDGGGIANDAEATVENTIVADNQGGNCSGALGASSPSNMADDSSCGPGFTQVALADLHLGSLAENGGPTQTIALGPGSVAIDAGSNAAARRLATDQRGPGYPRIVNCRVDIGAFEVQQRGPPCLSARD
jgi:CSLREA domain-containing protein